MSIFVILVLTSVSLSNINAYILSVEAPNGLMLYGAEWCIPNPIIADVPIYVEQAIDFTNSQRFTVDPENG